MKTAMHTKLLQYYNAQTLDILNITVFLDPCFKSLGFLEEVDKVSYSLNSVGKNCSLLLESVSDHLRYHSDATLHLLANFPRVKCLLD